MSFKNSVAIFVVVSLTMGLSGGVLLWLCFGLVRGFRLGVSHGLIPGLIGGLFAGVIIAFNRGGSAVMKRYSIVSLVRKDASGRWRARPV